MNQPNRSDSPGDEHPRGTLVILLMLLVAFVVAWGYVYMLMLNRG